MMDNSASSSYTITTASTVKCKYHLPCGYCELKKKNCDYILHLNPVKNDPDPYPFVSVYAAPSKPYPLAFDDYVDSIKVTPTNITCEDEEK